MDVLSALNAFLYTQKTPTQSSNPSSSNFVSWSFPWSPVTPTQAQVILSSAGPPGTLNLNHCTGHGQCCLHGCLFRSPASNPWQAVGALCFVTGDELGHQIVWWAEVESNPPACVSGIWPSWQNGKNWIYHKKKFSQSIHVQVLLQSMMGRKYGTSYTGGWNRMKGWKLGLIYLGSKK